jgi:hypothetical protein
MTGYSDEDLERMLFHVQPVHTGTLDDLDLRFFEKSYLPAAFARDVLEANDRSSSNGLRPPR